MMPGSLPSQVPSRQKGLRPPRAGSVCSGRAAAMASHSLAQLLDEASSSVVRSIFPGLHGLLHAMVEQLQDCASGSQVSSLAANVERVEAAMAAKESGISKVEALAGALGAAAPDPPSPGLRARQGGGPGPQGPCPGAHPRPPLSQAVALSQDLLEEIGGMKAAQSRVQEDVRTMREQIRTMQDENRTMRERMRRTQDENRTMREQMRRTQDENQTMRERMRRTQDEKRTMRERIRMIEDALGSVSCRRCPREGAEPSSPSLPLSPSPCHPSSCPAAIGVSQREGHEEARVGRVSRGGEQGSSELPSVLCPRSFADAPFQSLPAIRTGVPLGASSRGTGRMLPAGCRASATRRRWTAMWDGREHAWLLPRDRRRPRPRLPRGDQPSCVGARSVGWRCWAAMLGDPVPVGPVPPRLRGRAESLTPPSLPSFAGKGCRTGPASAREPAALWLLFPGGQGGPVPPRRAPPPRCGQAARDWLRAGAGGSRDTACAQEQQGGSRATSWLPGGASRDTESASDR